ncbi:MAG: glycosyltransferase [Bacteroidetes bacterium]|uniref:glycosyltransferase n=1 Tax=Flavobacterium sp. TaxID=239 RepID=UPI002FDAF8C5|nr:glycosyltransferase [Bacteroidota bacterium]
MNNPTVSICMITYNHAKYIEKAIEGVLFQKTNFNIELIISNDNSTDDTDIVIKKIIKEKDNHKIIKYFNQEKNLGMMKNFIFALNVCKGEYIALCEGDDYWTDENKLQKQIDFMKSNNEISFTFHRAEILFKENFTLNYRHKSYINKEIVEPQNFLVKLGARFCTPSVVFKKEVINPLPEWYVDCHVGDFPLMFLALEKGKIGYLEDIMCVYRLSSDGSWSQSNLKLKNRYLNIYKMINLNKFINKNTQGKYKKYLKTNLISYLISKTIASFK